MLLKLKVINNLSAHKGLQFMKKKREKICIAS